MDEIPFHFNESIIFESSNGLLLLVFLNKTMLSK